MSLNLEEDLDISDDLEEMEPESLELGEEINISSKNSEELCQIVIAFQYLGIWKDPAIQAMKELSHRRENGDAFDFESYILSEASKLPNFKEMKPVGLSGISKKILPIG